MRKMVGIMNKLLEELKIFKTIKSVLGKLDRNGLMLYARSFCWVFIHDSGDNLFWLATFQPENNFFAAHFSLVTAHQYVAIRWLAISDL